MEDEVLDNELNVNDSVPETLEENEQTEQMENVADSEVQDIAQDAKEIEVDIEKQIEERANRIAEEKMEARVIRERIKKDREYDSELSKYRELESVLKAGLGTNSLDETINKASAFYKEQGVNIPVQERKASLNERDAIVLAKADAQDIIKCGDKEMEYEANRIASIPRDKRSLRENVMFNELCKELTSLNNIKELKSKGYDTKVLDNEDFKEFSSHIVDKPIADIYDMYTKLYNVPKRQPKSPGSAKSNVNSDEVKEFYTPEEARKFTEEDLIKNPKLEEAIERSMLKWK